MANRLVLKENTVHYRLYPDLSLIADRSAHSDHLKDYILDCYRKLSDLLKDYYWHYEEFNLHAVDTSPDQAAHIEGTTCFEDNVEDEWFIVYLLIKLTQLDSRLVVTVEDSDGQFLLIEAADYLPNWTDPENTENRVFVYNGEVHLIPPSVLPFPKGDTDECTPITLSSALSVIRDERKKTKCCEKIQYSIRRRITMFPMQITGQKHRSHCFIPAGVATLLNQQPSLIAWAIRSFYHRDALDMKACRSMKYFPPENRVKRTVTFTKCLYAQAMSQRFQPDPKIGWNLPPKESPLFKSYDLGIKIACGFEILVSRVKSMDDPSLSPVTPDSCNERRWIKLVESLEEKGYFKSNLPGSRKHKDLLSKAYEFYRSSMDLSQDSITSEEAIGQKILKMLKSASPDYDRLKREENSLESEDSDDWITIDQEKLDSILVNQFSNGKDLDENLSQTIPEVLKSFINYEDSGIEGAEIPNEGKDWKPNGSVKDLEPVKFDDEKFGDALRNILSFRLPSTESSASSSGMSDYEMEDVPDEDEDSWDSDNDDDETGFRVHHHSEITPIKRLTKPKSKKMTKRKKNKNNMGNKKLMVDIKQYMEAMERELDETEIGKSFERQPMETTSTTVPATDPACAKSGPPLATFDEDEDLTDTSTDQDGEMIVNGVRSKKSLPLPPVDPELTALKNILESFDSQKGLPGPGSNLLSLMGVHLLRDSSPSSSSSISLPSSTTASTTSSNS